MYISTQPVSMKSSSIHVDDSETSFLKPEQDS